VEMTPELPGNFREIVAKTLKPVWFVSFCVR